MRVPDPKVTAAAAEPVRKLRSIIRELGRVLVAYSGGVDSTFLLHTCLCNLGADAVEAVVVDHPLLRDGEAGEAVDLAREMGVSVISLNLDPRQIREVAENTRLRCYHCKNFIFSQLREHADRKGIPWLLDGTNFGDGQGYRPGLKVLDELGVRSPLRDAGLSKAMIRELSRSEGLETWDKPSAPCLATRFPYDHPITDVDLETVKRGENILYTEGLKDLRLRVHGEIARVEVPQAKISYITDPKRRQRLVAALKALGYRYVTVDLEGLRSGSMDD